MQRITILLGASLLVAACGTVAKDPDAGRADAMSSADARAAAAQVINVTSPTADGGYSAAAAIAIAVTFSEIVTVTGMPQLSVNSAAPPVTYAGGTGTDTLTFSYVVAAGEASADLDYSSSTALALNGGTIAGAGGAADLTLAEPGTVGSLGFNKAIVVDAVAPAVTNVTSATPDGTYGAASVISVQVVFNEAVTVAGVPQLTLNSGALPVNYASGSGSETLNFSYMVASGQASADLDYLSTTALTLNSGTIRDELGNDALLTLPAPGGPGSLGFNHAIVIESCPSDAITFDYTGGLQSFTVPASCVASVTIDAYGAEGGTSTGESGAASFAGGRGARARGTFAVTPGQIITVLVGGSGANGNCGAAGGGGSFAVRDGALLVAAGGGGGGFHCNAIGGQPGVPGSDTTSGGDGICGTLLTRSPTAGGSDGNGAHSHYGGGGGGWLTAGTSGAVAAAGGGVYPGAGGTIGGGYGGGGGRYSGCCGGSGGGGGYSGGGGGVSDGCAGGGGGLFNAGTSPTNTADVRSGDGQVIVSY